jgi:membrane protein implicated in regulation of membrane protease activity
MAQSRSGTLAALFIAFLLAGASVWLSSGSNAIYCDRMAPLTVIAMLAAFVMALSFRLFARVNTAPRKWQLVAALVISAITIFIDARYVKTHRQVCQQLEQQMDQYKAHPQN